MDIPYSLAVHSHVQAAIRGCEKEQARYEDLSDFSVRQEAKYAAIHAMLLAVVIASRALFGNEGDSGTGL